jgi:hypothetical protein
MSDQEKRESPAPAPQSGEAQSPRPALSPEAQRALAEAEARRKAATPPSQPKELGGQKGPEPTRYGDWEKKGIVSDF